MIRENNKMETLIEILKEIKKYSEWEDGDTRFDLTLFLDEIHGLAIDAIEIQKKEGKCDGWVIIKDNEKTEKNRELLKKQVEFVKEAMEVYKSHPF